MVELAAHNRLVPGSNPGGTTNKKGNRKLWILELKKV